MEKGKIIIKNFLQKFSNLDSLKTLSNLEQRIASSLILVPIILYAIFLSKSIFLLLFLAIAILASFEWVKLIQSDTENKNKWLLIGFFYLLIPFFSILELRFINKDIILWLFFVVWSTDIFAYFIGKNIGGPKLIPSISPNKTWSGLIGGMLSAAIIGSLSTLMFEGSIIFFTISSIILALIAQAGDFFESKVKRIFNVKDSGNIIPGHGGILDRIDGLMFAAPAVLIIYILFQSNF
ncbi:phosphatidate cytidylyltransferase [Rickettsiales bacterium]|nr:phosphatidate cytidylyltransferase [Rickettsiales bacterium]MDB2550500.1 phosphatidate cytidylyltransferase [Rickettsiales bacterium]